jgi:hypothetical protein
VRASGAASTCIGQCRPLSRTVRVGAARPNSASCTKRILVIAITSRAIFKRGVVGTFHKESQVRDNRRTTAFCRVMPRPGSPEDNGRLAVFDDPDYEYED